MILGDLNATHLNRTVTWSHGGATYTGVLHSVKHTLHQWSSTARQRRTHVVIYNGDWKHDDWYSPFTRCEITGAAPAPLALANDTGEVQAR
jgi:hypothetical protein